jgi:hypothetical protein
MPTAIVAAASVFGGGGGGGGGSEEGIGVNSFLWRASLDTLNFMPLASADPFGGVIITDWYSDPTTPNERFKATVYILDTRLRADALNVSIFRQTQVERRLDRRDGRSGHRNPDRERDPDARAPTAP